MHGVNLVLLVKSLVLFAALILIPGQGALAFGTINTFGQNAEHERITRHALGCRQPGGPDDTTCFKKQSLDELAGSAGTFGAVGAPDNPLNGRINDPKSHCDDGDFLPIAGYPQTAQQAQAALQECRNWMTRNIDSAVEAAQPMVSNHRLVDKEIPTVFACSFNYTKGRAYCNVLEAFGAALHASQDFYAHSNWVDQPNPDSPISLTNPPGLAQAGPSPWLDLSNPSAAFPQGLITGCFKGIPPNGTSGCPNQVTHSSLNKDKGTIDPSVGAGTTPRGKVAYNFSNAVNAAIADTRGKWIFLQNKLLQRYGDRDGRLMICALVNGSNYSSMCHATSQ
jgi:hypothetical protein